MTISPFTVRPASATDARAIAEIHVYSWQAAYRGLVSDAYLDSLSVDKREEFWRNIIETKTQANLVLEESERVVGWAAFGPARDPDLNSPEIFELYAIYFHPSKWRLGLGKHLYQAVEDQIERLSVKSVVVWVLNDNIRALKFYHKMGFDLESGKSKEIEIGGLNLLEVRCRKNVVKSGSSSTA